jgi:hypothetical protein
MEELYDLVNTLKPDYVKLKYCPKFKEQNEYEIDIKKLTKKKFGKILDTYETEIFGVDNTFFEVSEKSNKSDKSNKSEKMFYKKRTYMFKDKGLLLVELYFTIDEDQLPYLKTYPITEKHIVEKYNKIEIIDKTYMSYNVLSIKNIMEEMYEFIHICE